MTGDGIVLAFERMRDRHQAKRCRGMSRHVKAGYHFCRRLFRMPRRLLPRKGNVCLGISRNAFEPHSVNDHKPPA